jgi:hypothetical protein
VSVVLLPLMLLLVTSGFIIVGFLPSKIVPTSPQGALLLRVI